MLIELSCNVDFVLQFGKAWKRIFVGREFCNTFVLIRDSGLYLFVKKSLQRTNPSFCSNQLYKSFRLIADYFLGRNKIKFRHSFVSAQVFGLLSPTSPLGFPNKVGDNLSYPIHEPVHHKTYPLNFANLNIILLLLFCISTTLSHSPFLTNICTPPFQTSFLDTILVSSFFNSNKTSSLALLSYLLYVTNIHLPLPQLLCHLCLFIIKTTKVPGSKSNYNLLISLFLFLNLYPDIFCTLCSFKGCWGLGDHFIKLLFHIKKLKQIFIVCMSLLTSTTVVCCGHNLCLKGQYPQGNRLIHLIYSWNLNRCSHFRSEWFCKLSHDKIRIHKQHAFLIYVWPWVPRYSFKISKSRNYMLP